MELKPGYKMTEVGVIPEDWDYCTLGEGLSSKPSYGVNAPACEYKKGLFPYIRITDITDDGEYIPLTYVDVKNDNFYLKNGDIVLARTGASVGKSYRYKESDGKLIYAGFLICIHPNNIIFDSSYIFYYLHTDAYWKWVSLTSMRSGQPGINSQEYMSMLLPRPSLPEQQAIAAALSDVDELLRSLDQLIAKKKDIRLAAMQELLTGKTRLPGFGGSWSRKRLEELAEINPENLSASTPSNYEFNYIALEDVSKGHLLKFSHYSFADSPVRARRIIKPKDILVSTVRPNLKSHLLATDNENNWICSTGFCIVRCHKNLVEPTYVYHSLFTDDIEYQIKLIVTGSNYPAINSSDVTNLKIYLPSSLAEQQAIASVLSDMDAEIEALEARRDKVRHIKAGMMQELLTGKTRLISSGERA